MAELFNTTKQNISLHLKNAFNDGELQENLVVKEFLTTAKDGKQYNTKYYNLDAIISVGYRVNSIQAMHFLFLFLSFSCLDRRALYCSGVFFLGLSLVDLSRRGKCDLSLLSWYRNLKKDSFIFY